MQAFIKCRHIDNTDIQAMQTFRQPRLLDNAHIQSMQIFRQCLHFDNADHSDREDNSYIPTEQTMQTTKGHQWECNELYSTDRADNRYRIGQFRSYSDGIADKANNADS